MSPCTNALTSNNPHCIVAPSLRQKLERVINAWKLRQQSRADRWIDGYFRRERDAHERFLECAGDRYQLERLERDWDRRHADFWRVF